MSSRRISLEHRIVIVTLKKEGHSVGEIKQIMMERYDRVISKRGIQKHLKKFETIGIYEDKYRSGRPLRLSARSERRIRRISILNRDMSLRAIMGIYNRDTHDNISRSTINRILIKYGLKSRVAVNKPFLTFKQRKRRVDWAFIKKDWSTAQWSCVVFSDESMFRSYSFSNRSMIRRFDNERINPKVTNKVLQHGPQVHVWGAFSRNGVGMIKRVDGILNAEKYQRHIINDMDVIGPCLIYPEKNLIFQHDLAPSHRSASTISFLKRKKIKTLDWPANSPDANPIENLWFHIKRKLNKMGPMPADEMWTAIQEIWYNIPVSLCRWLVDSMPRRMSAIMKMKGYPTKY